MSKKSEIGNEVANSMNELLENESFTKIFHNVKTASVKEVEIDTQAVSDYKAFDKFVSLAKKKDKDEDEESDKDDKKSDKKDKSSDKDDKKDDKKKDKKDDSDKDDKKDKKKGKKKGFPFWLKKKKASGKCGCSADCSCKEGKSCSCEGCTDCAACGDMMYASAIKHMVETLVRTSAALDNMGLEKSSVATMVALNHIIEEAAQDKFAADDSVLDENDVRGMDLLLGLEDEEAKEGFEDEELDDPHSSAALEEILSKNPELADDLSGSLKGKFDVEDQLKDRIRSRLNEVVNTKGDESDIEELAANKFPKQNDLLGKLPPVNDLMKKHQDEELKGDATIPAPMDTEWTGDNVSLDQLNIDDAEVVKAYKELDSWVKSAETVDGKNFNKMLESFLKG